MAVSKTQTIHDVAQNHVEVLPQTPYLLGLMTHLRDRNTNGADFVRTVDQVARILLQHALNYVPTADLAVVTGADAPYGGVSHVKGVCGISILRAGACMEQTLRDCWSGSLSFGQILIQRDPKTCLPVHLYSKFPAGFESRIIMLLEPMLATGGSACKAIELLLERGVSQENIVFVNFVASRHGIDVVAERFPQLKVVTAAIDAELDENRHIIPGLGDFGDRFYGTM